MANTDIKWFSFDNTNAPQLSNTWGCMIDVLDACLVTGFGSQIVSSINISNGVGVAEFGGAHNFKQFQVVEITSTSNPAINAEYKILGLTAKTIEFEVGLSDQKITGDVSCKLASLGWTKKFSGMQKAVYQAKDTIANPYFLRVDNSCDPVYAETYAKFAKVGILATCTGIDDLTGNQAPFNPNSPTLNWVGTSGGSPRTTISGWFKWRYTFVENPVNTSAETGAQTNGNRSWVLIGTKDSFFLINRLSANSEFEMPYGFGAVTHNDTPKPFLVAVSWANGASLSNSVFTPLGNMSSAGVAGLIDYTNTVIQNQFFSFVSGYGVVNSGVASNAIKLDSIGSYVITPIYLLDQAGYILGEVPLAKCAITNATNAPNSSLFFEGEDVYLACRFKTTSIGAQGRLFFKVY